MKRSGFTMIELIFVIVILGILAAVAIPRMVGVQESARQAKAGEFVSQLNSVVGPGLYAKAIASYNGSIASYIAAQTGDKATLAYYTEVPTGFGTADFTQCVAPGSGKEASPFLSDTTNSIYVYCRDGNVTDTPRFWSSTKSKDVKESDLNTSKSSV